MRDWHQFHTPKNLVMALSGEVGELTEIFQWMSPEDSRQVMENEQTASHVKEELADVLQYVIRLADILDVNLVGALWDKLITNEQKYPADVVKGSSKKYTEY